MGVTFSGFDDFDDWLNWFKKRFEEFAQDEFGQFVVSKSVKRLKQGKVKPPTSKFTKSLRAKPGGKTLLDTGMLWKSLTYKYEGGKVKVGSNLVYARTHQFGATIKPKKAQKLCIPATREARRLSSVKGVKGALEEFRKQGYRIWFTDRAIMGQKGKGKPQVLFYRKEEVKIPQRKFVYLGDKDWEEITEMIRGWVRE